MTGTVAEHTYRYLTASRAYVDDGRTACTFATSGGPDANPWLADGVVGSGLHAARALLAVATVAGTRFWVPPNMVAARIAASDPVVTAGPEALRFEAFSQCGGVYARFDLDADAFDGSVHRHGTTNVDVNPPLRAALAKVGMREPLWLGVGLDEVAVTTLASGRVVEKKVRLPERWVRGFAEVGVALSAMEPAFELPGSSFRSFLAGLPRATMRGDTWVVASGRSARVSTRPSPGSVAAGGVERLRFLRELAPLATGLTAFGPTGGASKTPGGAGASAWVLTLDGGAVTVALSPSAARGFSGEGGVLFDLSRSGVGAAGRLSQVERAEQAGTGRLGYDVRFAEWFDRLLPFDRDALDASRGRLVDARALVAAGAVTLDRSPGGAAATATVAGRAGEYRVRSVDDQWRCTCPWWGKHRGTRGPCKHVLATIIMLATSSESSES